MRRADRPRRPRKARDRAMILPLVGAILFLPPIAGIFRIEATLAGVPLVVVYIFAVWAALIAGAIALARRLSDADAPREAAGDDPGAG